MRKKVKIGTCPHCGRRHNRDYLCRDEYEGWTYSELREKEGCAGLVAHCQAVVEWKHGDADVLCALGSANLLNHEPEKAVVLLSEWHRKEPWAKSLQRVILGALFAQGKDETGFDWLQRLPVSRLDSSVLHHCRESLSFCHWSEHCTAGDLYTQIELVFTREERDECFAIEQKVSWDPGIRLAKPQWGSAAAGQRKNQR